MYTQLYINGQWVDGERTVAVYDPSDASVIAQVWLAGDAHCEAAIAAADAAAVEWAKTAPRYRSEILRNAFEIMTSEIEAIATLISRESGKAMPDARGEAAYAAEFFRWFAEETVRTPGDFRKSPSGDKRILVTHQPIGLSILITPWNFPAGMATRKIGPAIAAGCTMILKPATETPLTAMYIGRTARVLRCNHQTVLFAQIRESQRSSDRRSTAAPNTVPSTAPKEAHSAPHAKEL